MPKQKPVTTPLFADPGLTSEDWRGVAGGGLVAVQGSRQSH